jgi:hypothetical protein
MKDFDLAQQNLCPLEIECANKEAVFKALDCQTRTMLGAAFIRASASTAKEREMLALTDPIYTQHLKAVEIARKDLLQYEARIRATRARFKYCQSVVSMEKAKMNLL